MNGANKEDIKNKFCPNIIVEDGNISLGEFKTIQDAYSFPLQGIWCINRRDDNKFDAYKAQNTRMLIICSWNRNDNDSLKYVLALIHTNGKIYYWDMNDLPVYPRERINQYEGSLGDEITYTLYQIANQQKDSQSNNSQNENRRKNMNKNRIRLTESQLQRVIEESVKKVINESDFHRAFKSGKSLDVLHSPDGTYQDSDIWECLAELKEKLRQAEERAKKPQ